MKYIKQFEEMEIDDLNRQFYHQVAHTQAIAQILGSNPSGITGAPNIKMNDGMMSSKQKLLNLSEII